MMRNELEALGLTLQMSVMLGTLPEDEAIEALNNAVVEVKMWDKVYE